MRLEAALSLEMGEQERRSERTKGKGRRIGEHWYTYENTCRIEEKNVADAGR